MADAVEAVVVEQQPFGGPKPKPAPTIASRCVCGQWKRHAGYGGGQLGNLRSDPINPKREGWTLRHQLDGHQRWVAYRAVLSVAECRRSREFSHSAAPRHGRTSLARPA